MASPGRRAPENELNHGADMTLGTQQMDDRFSEAYARVRGAAAGPQFFTAICLSRIFIHTAMRSWPQNIHASWCEPSWSSTQKRQTGCSN
jgi:hypothetical protein